MPRAKLKKLYKVLKSLDEIHFDNKDWDTRIDFVCVDIQSIFVDVLEYLEAERELKSSLGYSRVGKDAMKRG